MLKRLHPRSITIYLAGWFLLALFYNRLGPIAVLFFTILALNWYLDRAAGILSVFSFAIPVMLLLILINTVFNQNGSCLLLSFDNVPLIGNVLIYKEPFIYGITMAIKLLLLLGIFVVFNILVPVENLIDVFGSYTGSIVMLVAISVGLIPVLIEKTGKISEIMKVRGIKPPGNKFMRRIRWAIILVENIVRTSLQSSLIRAEAMQARAYGSGKRSIYRVKAWSPGDTVLIWGTVIVIFLVLSGYLLSGNISNNPGIFNWTDGLPVLLVFIPILSLRCVR